MRTWAELQVGRRFDEYFLLRFALLGVWGLCSWALIFHSHLSEQPLLLRH